MPVSVDEQAIPGSWEKLVEGHAGRITAQRPCRLAAKHAGAPPCDDPRQDDDQQEGTEQQVPFGKTVWSLKRKTDMRTRIMRGQV